MDNVKNSYFDIFNDHFRAIEQNNKSKLMVDDVINFLKASSDEDVEELLHEFSKQSEEKRVNVKHLLTHISDKLPFQIKIDKSSELKHCSVSQFAVPIIITIDQLTSLEFKSSIPRLLLTPISEIIGKMIGIRNGDTLLVNESILSPEAMDFTIKEKFHKPEEFISSGHIDSYQASVKLTPQDGAAIVYLYCTAIRYQDDAFKGYCIDRLLLSPEDIIEMRDEVSRKISLWFSNKGISGIPHCGIPCTIPTCLEVSKALQREIRLSSFYENSVISSYRDILAIINKSPSEGIIVRLFHCNQCILAFNYGRPILYDQAGVDIDHKMIEARVRQSITNRVLHSENPTHAANIADLVDQPLIHSS